MDSHYQDKFDEFIRNVHNNMFTFEVTKCCGYSTFVTIYKNQSLIDLYANVIQHFGNIVIKELYFVSLQEENIHIPISTQSVSEFVKTNIICNPIKLVPIYDLPKPTIYRLYLNDGHCDGQCCSNIRLTHI